MEEIKGMSDHEARRWLMKHGYGLGEIDSILNTPPVEDSNTAEKAALMRQGYGVGEAEMLAAESAPAPKAASKPKPAPVAKAAPKPVAASAPKSVAKPAPKASK